MRAKITTTITTYIDLDTFEPEHQVSVDAEDALPRQVIVAAVEGGLRSALKATAALNPNPSEGDADA